MPEPARQRTQWTIGRILAIVGITCGWGVALAGSYNLYKHWFAAATQQQLPNDAKDAIRFAVPWSIGLASVLLVALARIRRRRAPLHDALAFLAAQNLAFVWSGWHTLAVIDLAAAMCALVVVTWFAARRLRRGSDAAMRELSAHGGRDVAFGAVCAVGLVVCALCVRQLYRQWNNTLLENGRWIATKTTHAKGGPGAVAFVVTRKPLSGSCLDLSTWHGYHEVLWRERVDPTRIDFDARLVDDAWVVLRFADSGEEYHGLRLSRHPELPSIWFRARTDGEFLETHPLAVDPGAGWFHVDLDLTAGNLQVDGAPATCPWPITGTQQVGFRGGKWAARVDDVAIRTRDGRVLAEDFSSREGGWGAFGIGLLAFGCLGAAIALLQRRRGRSPWLAPAALSLPIAACMVVLTAGDYWVVSQANPLWVDYGSFQTTIETADQVVDRLESDPAPSAGTIIACVGTSQTWGSGAVTDDDTWVARLQRLIDSDTTGDGPRYRCVNLGICGVVASACLSAYRETMREPPWLNLVTLSHNDSDPVAFRHALEEFVALDRERGTRTVFVLEPDSIEDVAPNLLPNHAIMREVAEANGVPVIDMPSRLRAYEPRGFLWFDHVHLDSFGHRVFAAELLDALHELGLVE